jgi:hypothetical protein
MLSSGYLLLFFGSKPQENLRSSLFSWYSEARNGLLLGSGPVQKANVKLTIAHLAPERLKETPPQE